MSTFYASCRFLSFSIVQFYLEKLLSSEKFLYKFFWEFSIHHHIKHSFGIVRMRILNWLRGWYLYSSGRKFFLRGQQKNKKITSKKRECSWSQINDLKKNNVQQPYSKTCNKRLKARIESKKCDLQLEKLADLDTMKIILKCFLVKLQMPSVIWHY